MGDKWKEGVEHDQQYYQSKQALVDALTGLEEALEAGEKQRVAEWEERVAKAEEDIAEARKRRARVAKGHWDGETAAVLSVWLLGEWGGARGRPTDTTLADLTKQCSLICKHMDVRGVLVLLGKYVLQHVRAATQTLLDDAIALLVKTQNDVCPLKYMRVIHNGPKIEGTPAHTHAHPFAYYEVDWNSAEGRMLFLLLDRFNLLEPYVNRTVAQRMTASSTVLKAKAAMQAVLAVGIVNVHHLHHCVAAEQIRELAGLQMSLCQEVVRRHGGRVMGFYGLAGIFLFPGDTPLAVLSAVLELHAAAEALRRDPRTVADKTVGMCLCLAQAVHLAEVVTCTIGGASERRYSPVGRGVEFAQSLLHIAATETLAHPLLLSRTFVTRARGDTVTALKYTFREHPSEFRVAGTPQVVFALGGDHLKKFDPPVADVHARFMAHVRSAKKFKRAGALIKTLASGAARAAARSPSLAPTGVGTPGSPQ